MKHLRYAYAVWELTLQCNLGCVHCGSRAANPRADELSTAEAVDLVRQMQDAGIREAGLSCTLTTGGYGISAPTADSMREAGIQQVSVSIDGTRETHDRLRGRSGSWKACFATLQHLRRAGISISCNTQINRLSAPELPLIYSDIIEAGCRAWQLAFTVPMGRAADRPEILLQPSELLDVFPLLNELAGWARRDGLLFFPGNNIGYYGPYERRLRSMQGSGAIWEGCQAGMNTIGIEANGAIKGCPSLPTSTYVGGNIREKPLREILQTAELNINAHQGTPDGVSHMWGFCQSCDYATLCRGGCTWTAHVFFGQPGNNPYCHHRALTRQKNGIRERLILETPAPGKPFDHGRFALKEEAAGAPWPEDDPFRFGADRIQWSRPPSADKVEFPILG
jgi:radical SAM protein with 4Fe4S-binding SPASM domain